MPNDLRGIIIDCLVNGLIDERVRIVNGRVVGLRSIPCYQRPMVGFVDFIRHGCVQKEAILCHFAPDPVIHPFHDTLADLVDIHRMQVEIDDIVLERWRTHLPHRIRAGKGNDEQNQRA